METTFFRKGWLVSPKHPEFFRSGLSKNRVHRICHEALTVSGSGLDRRAPVGTESPMIYKAARRSKPPMAWRWFLILVVIGFAYAALLALLLAYLRSAAGS